MSFTSDILFFMRKGEGKERAKKQMSLKKKQNGNKGARKEECKKDCERQSEKESHRVRVIEGDTKKEKEEKRVKKESLQDIYI